MALIKCPDCGTDVSDQAVACPKCARPMKAAAKARRSSPRASAEAPDDAPAVEDAPAAGASPTVLFPNFCRRPVACPTCGKKALRPRMRTRDFRCQACSAIFAGSEIEDAVVREDTRQQGLLDAARARVAFVRDLGADPGLAKLFRGLVNPKSERAQRFHGVIAEVARPREDDSVRLSRANESAEAAEVYERLPELRGVTLPPGTTLDNLLWAAKEAYPLLPDPRRRAVTPEEDHAASHALSTTLADHGVLAERVKRLLLHPDDVAEVLARFQRECALEVAPEDAEVAMAMARHVYVEDPDDIPMPEEGLNVEGTRTRWTDLTPGEQAEAFAMHRNATIATSLAWQERCARAIQRQRGFGRKRALAHAVALLSGRPVNPADDVDDVVPIVAKALVVAAPDDEPAALLLAKGGLGLGAIVVVGAGIAFAVLMGLAWASSR